MAPRRAAAAQQEAEEVFEDLRPEDDTPADGGKGLSVLTDDEDDEDDELQVADDDGEEEDEGDDAGAGAAAADEEDAEEEDEEEEEAAPVAGSDFDPKDVVILTGRIETLELRESTAASAKTRAESDLAAAKAAMKVAKEAGDTDADIAATEAYSKATVALANAETAIGQIANAKQGLVREAQALLAKAPKDAEGRPILDRRVEATPTKAPKAQVGSKLANTWLAKNPWYGDKKFAGQAAVLQGIDTALAGEKKLDKNSPEYFAELGRRFNKVYPGVFKGIDGKAVATGERKRGTGRGSVIPGGDGGAGRPAPKTPAGAIKLDRNDLKQMARFGMDPDDMAQRRTWLNEKRALAAKES